MRSLCGHTSIIPGGELIGTPCYGEPAALCPIEQKWRICQKHGVINFAELILITALATMTGYATVVYIMSALYINNLIQHLYFLHDLLSQSRRLSNKWYGCDRTQTVKQNSNLCRINYFCKKEVSSMISNSEFASLDSFGIALFISLSNSFSIINCINL